MHNSPENQCGILSDNFMNARMAVSNPDYDEVLLRNILLSARWNYINEDVRLRYAAENVSFIKSEVESRLKTQTINIKFLCDTGYSLYCINSKIQNLSKFIGTYNKLVLNWGNRYIQQLYSNTDTEQVNLSYENGLCCIICYMLLYSTYFTEPLNLLIEQLTQRIQPYLSGSNINFGMRYGIGGYLYTLNTAKKKLPWSEQADRIINSLFDIYLQNTNRSDGFCQWPAIRKNNGELVNNIADTWSYGPSMILYNLLDTNILQNNYIYDFKREIINRSYLPVGDLYLNDVGFYSGYAGILNVFCLCSEKYNDKCFEEIKKKLYITILEAEQEEGIFHFYKFANCNGYLEKIMDADKNQIIESYRVYIELCKALEG